MINKNTQDIDQHDQDLVNKAVGYVIRKYLFEIKKYIIDPTTKSIQTEDDIYEMIKYLVLNDKEFQKFTFDNHKIRICYHKEKDHFYVEDYN